MKDHELLKKLEFALVGRAVRIRDLEQEVASLRVKLAAAEALNKAAIEDKKD